MGHRLADQAVVVLRPERAAEDLAGQVDGHGCAPLGQLLDRRLRGRLDLLGRAPPLGRRLLLGLFHHFVGHALRLRRPWSNRARTSSPAPASFFS